MSKKIILSLALLLALAGTITSSASAQAPQPPARPRLARGWGEITRRAGSQLFVQNRQSSITLDLDPGTRLLAGSEADLVPGRLIAYAATIPDSGSVLARLVIILPEDFNILSFRATSGIGEVWAVDLANNTLTLHTRGVERVYQVTQETSFSSVGDWLQGLAGLPIHQRVLVIGKRSADGSLTATRIAAGRPQRIRYAGKITRIDLNTQQVTLQSLDGRSLTFAVDENTTIEAPDHTPYSLGDLAPGTPALVVATHANGTDPLAVQIIVRLKTSL